MDIVEAIYATYKDRPNLGRPHLGASEIGHECDRYLWLKFRWSGQPDSDGRVVRLFETGTLQEARLIADLRACGLDVSDRQPDGTQWSFKAIGGHFGGSMDCEVRGLPDDPGHRYIVEFKTANDRSWKTIQSKGVRIAKPQHFSQMQAYMGWSGVDRALYLVVNKNTDEIFAEVVEFDGVEFSLLMERAKSVVTRSEPAIPISGNPSSMPCKWCHFSVQCHGTDAPDVNCRTCVHSTPETDGDARWSCALHGKDLTVEEQREGCSQHLHIPSLLGRIGDLIECSGTTLTYRNRMAPDLKFQQPGVSSRDITNCYDKTTLGIHEEKA